MKQKKYTKRALCMSLLSMLLCVSMLVGTTFAWFTDSVTSGRNKIVAGNLDVELYHSNANVKVEQKVTKETMLFSTDINGATIKWEPGVIAYENFTVKNEGSLALKYALALSVFEKNTVKVEGVDHALDEVIQVAFVEGKFDGGRADAEALEYKPLASTVKAGYLLPKSEGTSDDTADFAIVLYWKPTDNDNIYNLNNGKAEGVATNELYIKLGVDLVASQYTYESDSFDDQYDLDARDPAGKLIPVTKVKGPVEEGTQTHFYFHGNTATGENGTTFDFEAGALPAGEAELNVVVAAVPQDPSLAGSPQDVAVINVTMFVDGKEVTEFNGKYVTITTYLEPGLRSGSVKVLYNGEALGSDAEVNYENDTGKLTFKTNHFSEYVISAVSDPKFTVDSAQTLKDAIAKVNEAGAETETNATVTLDGDVTVSDTLALSAGNVTFNLNGNNLTVKNESGTGITVAAGASLKLTDPSGEGNLVLSTCKSNNQALYAKGTSRTKMASVTFENINITVENTYHGTTSNANGVASAIYVGNYATATFGEGTVITANDDEAMHCNAYVAYADGANSVVNISGAKVTADGTVTPFATGNGTLNMTDGTITISSNNGSAALMVAHGSGVVNMTGGTIEVTGDLTGGRGGSVPASWGANFKDYCFGVATTWTADDDEAELNVSGGVIELTPTSGTAVGVATTFPSCWSVGYVGDNAVINCKAEAGATARAVGAMNGSTLGIYDSAVTELFPTGGDNAVIADMGPFAEQGRFGVLDRRTKQ